MSFALFTSELQIPFFEVSTAKGHRPCRSRNWTVFHDWVKESTLTDQPIELNIRYDVVNLFTPCRSWDETSGLRRWLNGFLDLAVKEKLFIPDGYVMPTKLRGELSDLIPWARGLLRAGHNQEKLEGSIIPRVLLDWQVQYMQTVVPILALKEGTHENSWRATVRDGENELVLNRNGCNFLSLLLLLALRKDTKLLIKSLKRASKVAVRHCATAKNNLVMGPVDESLRQCVYPADHNKNYWMPLSKAWKHSDPDYIEDDASSDGRVIRPFHKFGHIIYDANAEIVRSMSNYDLPPKKILEVVRFLYQSRANTVANTAMKDESLAEWKALLTESEKKTPTETLDWVYAGARQLIDEAVEKGYTLPHTVGHLINSSGKREATSLDGGTAEAIRRVFGDRFNAGDNPEYDLRSLEEKVNSFQRPGDLLVNEAISKITAELGVKPEDFKDQVLDIRPGEAKDCLKFDAISVMEISKARTASIGSVTLQIALNALAAIGLPAMKKIPESAGAATGGNLAFKFHKQLLENQQFVGDLKRGDATRWMLFSSDLSAATDSGRKDVAKAALSGFFSHKVFDPIRGFTNLIISLYCASRYLGEVEALVGWLMGEPITKLLLMIINTTCWRRAKVISHDSESEGCFNGDDVFIATIRLLVIEAYLRNIAEVGLRTSWDDTFVSNVDHMYIYSEEVGLMPIDLRTAPLVAVETNRKHLASDILSFKRKLWVPYSKGNGWFANPCGRFAAMAIEHGHRFSNPTCTLLMQLGCVIGGLTGYLRACPECLPCVDTRKGGNAFPIPFPVTDRTIESAIAFQIESGMRVARENVENYVNLALQRRDISWREYLGKQPLSIREMQLTDTARRIATTIADDKCLTFKVKHTANSEATMAHLLVRTGAYMTQDRFYAKLRALSRFESIFDNAEITRDINEDSLERSSNSSVSETERGELFNQRYIDAIRLQEESNSYDRTTGITTLVKTSDIDKYLNLYKFHLPTTGDSRSNSEEEEMGESPAPDPEQVAAALLAAYEKQDWLDILNICRKYRTSTDPILISLVENFPDKLERKVELVSLDRALQDKMSNNLDPGNPASCSFVTREKKEIILLEGLKEAAEDLAQLKPNHHVPITELMFRIVNSPTIGHVRRWQAGIGRVLQASNDNVLKPVRAPAATPEDKPRKRNPPSTFQEDHLVLPDWGHIRALMWEVNLVHDPVTRKLAIQWTDRVTHSQDGRTTTSRSFSSTSARRVKERTPSTDNKTV